jgi:hypothetical protein
VTPIHEGARRAFYAGWPRAMSAIADAKDVFNGGEIDR